MNNKERIEFNQKLHKLLKEYNVGIGFACKASSDLHGVHGEQIIVYEKETGKALAYTYGYKLDLNDLLEE